MGSFRQKLFFGGLTYASNVGRFAGESVASLEEVLTVVHTLIVTRQARARQAEKFIPWR